MILINVVACEFCGHSERFRSPDQVGSDLDIYDVVRARICKHEQRCEKNPLVMAIKDMRVTLEAVAGRSSFLDRTKAIRAVIRKTYDCFLDQVPPAEPIKPPPKPIRPTARPRIEIEPGAVAVGSKVQIVSRRKPGAVQAKRKGTSSEYFGVSFNKAAGKWVAQFSRSGVRWYGGHHEIEESAAIAVQEHLGNTAEAERIRALIPIKAEKRNAKKAIKK